MRGKILRGVDFGNDARPESIREAFTEIQDELVDLAECSRQRMGPEGFEPPIG